MRPRRISNKEYYLLTNATDRTALRDLAKLVDKRVLRKIGRTGRSTHYAVWSHSDKPDINPTLTRHAKDDRERYSNLRRHRARDTTHCANEASACV